MKHTVLMPVFMTCVLLVSGENNFYRQAPVLATFDRSVAICGNLPEGITKDRNGKYIPVLPGLGNHSYSISTTADSAQVYFDQGINFYYSYHFREAQASFKEAARFDKDCAMAYWGQALAMGPYYNNYTYKMDKQVPQVLQVMAQNIAGVSEKEKDLIYAMQRRYSSDTTNADRVKLDSDYAASMRLLVKKHPNDNDVKALYIDAVMLQHKWDFWYNNGTPKAWTPELVQLSQEILKSDSTHPAALHYFIHLTEASRHPEIALPDAEKLRNTMPGVGHMVHMATHSYQRNGFFSRGVVVNEEANDVNNRIDSLVPSLQLGRDNVVHIYAVQSYCAMNAGMYRKGLPVYQRTRERLIAQQPGFEKNTYAQFVYMIPVVARVRLGKWQEILKANEPDTKWKYASLLNDFAKGMACVRSGNIPEAKRRLTNIKKHLANSQLAIRLMPFNAPKQCGIIASELLSGEILFAEKRYEEALTALKKAVDEEDNLIYREPQDWLIPSRQYLGLALLRLNRASEAAKVYQEDLTTNPGNGWSLLGMFQCLSAQKKLTEAAAYKKSYQRAFAAADVMPDASAY
ncbi:hypothetical protein GS399_09765 [Pedobacter sp. HMF7647]|uniref:Tetratricopeptide repeat protein n=1 Tax=Hufsiella arboris TaxID=2695275 RepID=A0A7K1Y9J7_9SPHI|nr:hypothetical protein [Hufsiella arboris]MXV51254.1 hypothetical protein [Hufsiella arboris]